MMANFLLTFMSLALAAETGGPALRPERAEALFIELGQPAVLRWHAVREPAAGEIRYSVRDFQDREVAAGVAARPAPTASGGATVRCGCRPPRPPASGWHAVWPF